MDDPVGAILKYASPALGPDEVVLDERLMELAGSKAAELVRLLQRRNGFFAFDAALHVYPSSATGIYDLNVWHDPKGWIADFEGYADGALFFAQDIYGVQHALKDGAVHSWDPEYPFFKPIAESIEDWARLIITDGPQLTGWLFARKWRAEHGALEPGRRLYPKIPFVLGGEYELDNLYAGNPLERMSYCGSLWVQLKDAKPGDPIALVAVKD